MSEEYTPTTDEVRSAAATLNMCSYSEFDRWLAEVERAAAEKALLALLNETTAVVNDKTLIELADKYAGFYSGVRSGGQREESRIREHLERYRRGGSDE